MQQTPPNILQSNTRSLNKTMKLYSTLPISSFQNSFSPPLILNFSLVLQDYCSSCIWLQKKDKIKFKLKKPNTRNFEECLQMHLWEKRLYLIKMKLFYKCFPIIKYCSTNGWLNLLLAAHEKFARTGAGSINKISKHMFTS